MRSAPEGGIVAMSLTRPAPPKGVHMKKSMLVDATHAEETRVAVVEDGRIADFDYESNIRQQLKGSIFLAKVTRVEPSLQAAFVNFGGNRHGFLPFNEIHPDYFRIPISDREAIIAEQKAYMDALAAEEEAADLEEEAAASGKNKKKNSQSDNSDDEGEDDAPSEDDEIVTLEEGDKTKSANTDDTDETSEDDDGSSDDTSEESGDSGDETSEDEASDDENDKKRGQKGRGRGRGRGRGGRGRAAMDSRKVEVVGGDIVEGEHTPRPTLRKNYKIQEVVKRGQIMLVQAQKEERGNKGAAVTSYISLPGRYCVLMPNSPRGGGVSRKIANYKERKRMREILKELNVPEGMSVILRTAGVARTKVEIKRDLDYLMRLWDDIRALTLESIAPSCVYEEGSLIKRAIRDIYTRDVEEVVISGDGAFKEAKKFMKMLIPSHAKKVKEYGDANIPLFHKYKVESQIAEMGVPEARLRSGGSIVINPTEALVAIDVNSGRATKERHIEETALRTNLEAAEEVARQLKLRDLGGLIVIDFIDMENYRNNAKVERRLKECLSSDRARIQIGRISTFGLLELSRQRMNPSMTEAQFKLCESCKGLGHTRTTDSTAVIALRTVEEFAINHPGESFTITVTNKVALYILNNKRDMLSGIEQRHGLKVALKVDNDLAPAEFLINDKAPVLVEPDQGKSKKQQGRNNNKNSNNSNNNNRNNNKNNNNQNSDAEKGKKDSQQDNQQDKKSSDSKADEQNNAKNNGQDKPKRRRGRKPRKDEAQNADTPSENTDAKDINDNVKGDEAKAETSKTDAPQTDPAKDAPPKKGRKPSARASKAKAKKEQSSEDQASQDQAQSEPKDEKPAKKKAAPKKAAKKSDADTPKQETPQDEPKSKNAEVKVVTRPVEEPTQPAEAEKDYEVVNQAPKKKKKGWWSR